jgi:hypothetical protein
VPAATAEEMVPRRTGTQTSGTSTSRSGYAPSTSPRRSAPPGHSVSSTTRSICRSSSVASVPKSASTSITPRPRISMWYWRSFAARPRSTAGEMRRTCTTSSATRRWPRDTRSSAASLLPMPLFPRIRTPSPYISTRSPWRSASGASSSSSQAVAVRMNSAVRSVDPSTGTSAASAGSVRTGGGSVPFVTTKHATPAAATAATASRARVASSVPR